MEFHWNGIGLVAQGVILTLLGMSILSVTVMVERALWIRRARRLSRQAARDVAGLLRSGRLDPAVEAAEAATRAGAHLGPVLAAGLAEWRRVRSGPVAAGLEDAHDAALLAARSAADDMTEELRRGLPTLATVASTAPFVGLFGTTFGIMHAFQGIGDTGSGGLSVISSGIAEALVTTAFGLVVAVPALWAHNSIADQMRRLGHDAERAARELAFGLVRQAV